MAFSENKPTIENMKAKPEAKAELGGAKMQNCKQKETLLVLR